MRLLIETIPWWIWLVIMGYAMYSILKLAIKEKSIPWFWRIIAGLVFSMVSIVFVLDRIIAETGYFKEYLPIVDNSVMPLIIVLWICGLFCPCSASISEERKKAIKVARVYAWFLTIAMAIMFIIVCYYEYVR